MAQQLTGLHAKFTGDSSSFVRATKLAQLEANKLDAQMRKSKREQEALAASGATLAKEYHRLRMETDNAYAAQVRFEKAAKLVRQTAEAQKWSTEQLNAELMRLAGHYKIAEVAGLSMNEQVRSARFHTANLAAQFNDIGVMLAAGQSPFMLAIQQGTQITQVLQDMGGGARQTFKALGSAFMSIISPTSLLTIGLIAGGAALAQWAMSSLTAADNTEELKNKQEALKAITEGLTEATKNLRLERQMADSGVTTQVEQEAENELNRLLAERAAIQERLNNLQNVGSRAAGYAQQKQDQLDALNAEKASLDQKIQALQYEKQLQIAARNRANEFRDNAKAEFDERQRIIRAHADQIIQMGRARSAQQQMNEAAQIALEKYGMMRTVAGGVANQLERAADAAFRLAQQQIAAAGKVYSGRGGNPATANQQGYGEFNYTGPQLDENNNPIIRAAGGRGGGAANAIQNQLEQLQNSLLSQEQLEMESYQRRQELLDQALQKKMISQQDHARLMEQVEATHQFAMLREQNKGVSNTLSALGSLFQGSKKIGAAVALANSWIAFTEVLKDPAYIGRPWARFAAAASALSSGLNAVRNIKSAQPGGSSGGAVSGVGGGAASAPAAAPQTSSQVALQLVGGDMFSRDQVMKLINAINDATADGARIILR